MEFNMGTNNATVKPKRFLNRNRNKKYTRKKKARSSKMEIE
jgi:hypothetical protein